MSADQHSQILSQLAMGSDIRGTASHERLLAAGPLSKQPGTMPYRIVLVSLGDEFVVYSEVFETEGVPKPSYSHAIADDIPQSNFNHGNYFRSDSLVAAVEKFGQRVAEHAKYLQVLYRVVQV